MRAVFVLLALAGLAAVALAEDTVFTVEIGSGTLPPSPPPPPDYNTYQHYKIAGTSLREVHVCRGTTYRFDAKSVSLVHPFYFDYQPIGGGYNPVEATYFSNGNAGLTGDDSMTFTPTSALTVSEIYYGCTVHERMGWKVLIKNRGTEPAQPAQPVMVAQDPTGIKASWPANEANECRPSVTAYAIQRKGAKDTSFTTLGSVPHTGAPLTYTDNKVTSGSQYQYRVIASQSVGADSVPSAVATAYSLPGKVTGVAAAQNGPGSVKITWASAGDGISFYWLTTSLANGERLVDSADPREVIFSGLASKQQFDVQLAASNPGGVGPFSSTLSVTVAPICEPACNTAHGSCTDTNVCTCTDPTKWDGPTCDNPICDPDCLHGGACIGPDDCDCPVSPVSGEPLWDGPICENPVCDRCVNGTCSAPNNCTCITGYFGDHCDEHVEPEPYIFPLKPAELIALIAAGVGLAVCLPAAALGYRYKQGETRKKNLRYIQEKAAGMHKPPFADQAAKTQRGRQGSGQMPSALTGAGSSLKMTPAQSGAPPVFDVEMASSRRAGSSRNGGASSSSSKSNDGAGVPLFSHAAASGARAPSSSGRRSAPGGNRDGSTGSGRRKKPASMANGGASGGSRGSKRRGSSKKGGSTGSRK